MDAWALQTDQGSLLPGQRVLFDPPIGKTSSVEW